MHRVNRSALVPFTAKQMFVLVDDVERYPEFVPWCSDAIVHFRDARTIEATLEMSRSGLKRRFRTRNRSLPGAWMTIALVDGPFRRLDGGWTFTSLGDTGSKVALEIEFEFQTTAIDRVFGRFFEISCTSLVDAFTQRAAQVYGQGRGA